MFRKLESNTHKFIKSICDFGEEKLVKIAGARRPRIYGFSVKTYVVLSCIFFLTLPHKTKTAISPLVLGRFSKQNVFQKLESNAHKPIKSIPDFGEEKVVKIAGARIYSFFVVSLVH